KTEKLINYNNYNYYNYYNYYNLDKMENTTIAISKEVKEGIIEFGNKGETYSDILKRLIKSARERQLHDLLMSDENTVSIDEALANAKKRWRK
ncbi:MAG: hypothetical protein AABW91_04405, partial [Nanoarchaeota archaeon]